MNAPWGAAAYGPKHRVRNFAPDQRKDFVDKVGDAIFVRHPVHGTGKDHGVRLLGFGGRLEVLRIHACGNHGDAAGFDILEKKRAIVFRNGHDVIRQFHVTALGAGQGARFQPADGFHERISSDFVLALPNLRLHIMREQDGGRWCFPMHERAGHEEIADDHIESGGCQQFGVAAAHFGVEELVDGDGPASGHHTGGAEILAEAAAGRERHGHDFREKAVAAEMLVVGMLRVEGEEGNFVAAGELFEDLEAADLAAHVGG